VVCFYSNDYRFCSFCLTVTYYWHQMMSATREPGTLCFLHSASPGKFSLHHHIQTSSGAHPVFFPVGTMGSFPGVKRPGREADHSPPSSVEVKGCVELYLYSPSMLSWRGAQKHRDKFTFTLNFIFHLYERHVHVFQYPSSLLTP